MYQKSKHGGTIHARERQLISEPIKTIPIKYTCPRPRGKASTGFWSLTMLPENIPSPVTRNTSRLGNNARILFSYRYSHAIPGVDIKRLFRVTLGYDRDA